MTDLAPRRLPLSTPALPGTGGAERVTEDDFEVEELPLYPASGAGEHLYVTVEKRGLSTQDALREVARALGADPRDAGYAGLKDKRAVARQRFSLPWTDERAAKAAALAGERWRVLSVERHANKLRVGHLAANRFRVRLRATGPEALPRAAAILRHLEQFGVPNYFGPQRFGPRQDNAPVGRAVLLGLPEGRRAAYDRFKRRMVVSALQSELFNRLCAARVAEASFGAALAGDVLHKRASGGAFVCEDAAVDGPRCASGECDPAGPMFGPKLLAARGIPGEREAAVLAEAELTLEDFAKGGADSQGARRPYRVPLDDARAETDGDGLVVAFRLPRGAYATNVLRELTKLDLAPEGDDA